MKLIGFALAVNRDSAYSRPARQSKDRVKHILKQLTERNLGASVNKTLNETRLKMCGWSKYYSINSMKGLVNQLDRWFQVIDSAVYLETVQENNNKGHKLKPVRVYGGKSLYCS